MKKFVVFGIILLAIAGGSIWYIFNGGKADQNENTATPTTQDESANNESPTDNIAVTINNRSSLDTMYTNLEASGVLETLEGTEQYTVIAVTDKAFEATDEATLKAIKSPANNAQLKRVMQYHLIKGELKLEDLKKLTKVPTLLGQELIVEAKEDQVYLIDAKGQKGQLGISDIKASNGVIHEINLLLLPQ